MAAASGVGLAATTDINFWHGLTAADGDTLGEMVKQFEKDNPTIRVKVQKIVWEALYDKLLVSMAAGKPPEVFIVHRDEFDWFRSAKALRVLDPYINGPNGIPKDDRVDTAWQAVSYNGKLYGVPLDNHNHNMVYNVDFFLQAGLDPGNPPTTGEEFLMACQKLTKADANGKVTRPAWAMDMPYWDFLTVVYQSGVNLLNPERTKATLATEGVAKGLIFLTDLRFKYKVSDFLGADRFVAGKAAIVTSGPWWENSYTKAKNLKWAAAPIPQFGPVKATAAGGHCMFIPPVVTGKKLDASVRFVKWMSDHSVAWAKAGQLPVRKSALVSKEFLALPLQSAYAKMLPYDVFEPIVRRERDVRAAWWDNAAWKVMNGRGEAKQELAKAADQINKILATVNKK